MVAVAARMTMAREMTTRTGVTAAARMTMARRTTTRMVAVAARMTMARRTMTWTPTFANYSGPYVTLNPHVRLSMVTLSPINP